MPGSIDRSETAGENDIIGGSRIISAGISVSSRVTTLIKESYCYRWLTKEPDPEVIVIDLRETHTVGPFIALLDRIIPAIERAWQHSRGGSVVQSVYKRL
ncbi:MAG: hypothetical protein ABEH86_04270, partial [Haloarcula sp.]